MNYPINFIVGILGGMMAIACLLKALNQYNLLKPKKEIRSWLCIAALNALFCVLNILAAIVW